MPALPRKTQSVFGSSLVPAGNVAKFGSLAQGAAGYSNDLALIQTAQWLLGFNGALIGNRSPAQEDMNALMLVITQQLAYLLQSGVPEWDSNTTYWKNQYARIPGTQFVAASLTDNNTNHDPATDSNNWDLTAQSSTIQVVTSGAPQGVTIGDGSHKVLFPSAGWNPRGYWNVGTSVFTAPVRGMYSVGASLQVDNNGATPASLDGFLRVQDEGSSGILAAAGWSDAAPVGSRWYPQMAMSIPLTAGQQIGFYLGGVSAAGGAVLVSNSALSISRLS